MAHSTHKREEVMVGWEKMRGYWIYSAFKLSEDAGTNVKTYLNHFVGNNPRFSFTIAQLYDEIFYACITTTQSSEIKRKLERKFRIELPDAQTQELLDGGGREIKSFRNAHQFRQLREKTLPELNKPIIKNKHAVAKKHFTTVRNEFNQRNQHESEILAFDIEVYEHDHSKMLEIGYVIVRFSPTRYPNEGNLPSMNVTSRKHLIIEENLHYKNKDNVPDNRYGFKFGVSETMSMEAAVQRFREDIIGCDYILGHSVKHDDAYLKDIGVDLSVLGKAMFDTQVVETYKESLKESNKYFMRGLSNLLRTYNLDYEDSHLHNAGCDAFYTMMVFLRQMGYDASTVNAIIAS
ncbi:uncharacterized protein YDR514C-like [Dendronephthya gigantea]|uniref:uncharacterized protein YDR514C-like n=1 Tax=Dendronephthya gigantea TaxID=151771 RepID=UPI001069DD4F|nr:uncharacterized protein YDR514C-like [Dendronephthya gigantea]XP_028402924.1 uncharacterized protein YDR514C-like [Dendronephthya gigantea]XP_028402925.1 uncharacterized protein YDR514C-like [Dendronephthya gigantea]XP_028402926.1 uncharacterized protein YDR514C-like [Dendronephthya gigantea]